ncbi:MAG: androgen-induced gene 1 family protein [archaeon]|nr:androgen-induced gene 1 family protein [archaeon]
MSLLQIIYHSIVSILDIIAVIWDRIVGIPKFPKNFLYMTQNLLYLHTIYFISSLYHDLKHKNSTNYNQKLYNLVLIIGFFTIVMYWPIYITNRDSVISKRFYVPFILNFYLHAFGPILCFCEQLIFNKRKTKEHLSVIFFICLLLGYNGILSLLYVYFKIKVYPYIYSGPKMFLITVLGNLISGLIGHYIYVWSSKIDEKTEKDKNKEKLTEGVDTELQEVNS